MKGNRNRAKNGTDINSIMCEMMSIILEGALDEAPDENLGYSKYDYHKKKADNSRKGHFQKTMNVSFMGRWP